MASRRTFLVAGGTFFSTSVFAADSPCNGTKSFPSVIEAAATANGDGRAILALDQGAATPWEVSSAIGRNFQSIIEQNVQGLPTSELRRLIMSMSNAELNDLAFRYNVRAQNSGKTPVLLDLLARRCDQQSIARLGDYFGFEDVYAALYRVAPARAENLANALDRTRQRASRSSIQSAGKKEEVLQSAGIRSISKDDQFFRTTGEPMLDYTIGEIYLSYRTAPVGSLSVPSALYETASFAGTRLLGSFGVGYTAGTAINALWSTYAPESYAASSDFIGQAVDGFVDGARNLLNGSTFEALADSAKIKLGEMQKSLFNRFGSIGPQATYYTNGGDYGVSRPWFYYVKSMSCK